jgi:hypothetical protein
VQLVDRANDVLADNREQPRALITGHAATAAGADFVILAVPGDRD